MSNLFGDDRVGEQILEPCWVVAKLVESHVSRTVIMTMETHRIGFIDQEEWIPPPEGGISDLYAPPGHQPQLRRMVELLWPENT